MDYIDYQLEDFLSDEFFIRWVNEPTEETNHFWDKWLQNHPDKRKEVEIARQISSNIHYEDRYELNDQHYTEMFERIIREDLSYKKVGERRQILFWISGIAACILVVLGLGWKTLFSQNIEQGNALAISYITKANPKGIKSSIVLGDGTKVKLNSESSLRVPEKFFGNERRVYLEGEAFFEVVEDINRPFIVVVDNVEARVLGTSFNINNFNNLSIALVEGKLQVSDFNQNQILLRPDEMITFSAGGKINKDHFDRQYITGWHEGTLVFMDEPLEMVFEKIERWYGVEVLIDNKAQLEGTYSGSYFNEPLTNVLKGISLTSGFSYELNNKKLKIMK